MDNEITGQDVEHERRELLLRVERAIETPIVVLGVVWLALLVWELIYCLSPLLEMLGVVIWGIFVLHFALEVLLAPRKGVYLKSNWLTAVALLVPALRTFRVIRVADPER
jgi:voltage-gated potassium channel